MEKYCDKKILIVGVGKSGLAVLKYLIAKNANVSIADDREYENLSEEIQKVVRENNLKVYCGKNIEINETFEIVIVSPGVSLEKNIVLTQQGKGAEVIGELELAYRAAKGNFVAITGTNGKTTTTSLVGEIFKVAQKDTRIVGNIGAPVIDEASNSSDDTWFVTEASSFQLESVVQFCPRVSAILNITPDHLDRHKTMDSYTSAKLKIGHAQLASDYEIVNKDDVILRAINTYSHAKKAYFTKDNDVSLGTFVRDDAIFVKDDNGKEIHVIDIKEIPLPGTHNLENALAATAICFFSGISKEDIRKGIISFKGVEHRVEIFKEFDGIRFINDSKGTNPDATIKAIEAMKENIVLFAGGYDKNADYKEMLEFGKGKIKALYLIGQTKEKIKDQAIELGYEEIYTFENLAQCVKQAVALAVPGDNLLLSPACASWGMYNNYEERGREFKEEVIKILEG